MANCCGGKNAGKPINLRRYLAGLGVFLGYHGGMRVLLSTASIPIPALRKVRDFHRQVMEQDLKEILALQDINLNGRLDDQVVECPVDLSDGVRTVDVGETMFELAAPMIPVQA